MAGNKN